MKLSDNGFVKGLLRAAIFKSAETLHLIILLCYLGNAIRCAVSADLALNYHHQSKLKKE